LCSNLTGVTNPRCVSQTPQDAFAAYVLPEVHVLRRAAGRMTTQPADAEDLVQETLLRAYKAIDRFDGRYPRAWLLAILRNAEFNHRRRRVPHLVYAPDPVLERLAVPGDSPEEVVAAESLDGDVGAALATLSPDQRQAIRLVHIEGLSCAEAAAVLDVPPGTVMSRLHRGRNRMRVELTEAGRTEEQKFVMHERVRAAKRSSDGLCDLVDVQKPRPCQSATLGDAAR
jgi:RNA polymerase sigma-70 factor (ECF subfamily)